jgi:ABC-type cobalamin transport system permease subunit
MATRSSAHRVENTATSASLFFASFALFIAVLFLSSKDTGWFTWVLIAVGGGLVATSIPLFLRKRRRNAAQQQAYERWRSERGDR